MRLPTQNATLRLILHSLAPSDGSLVACLSIGFAVFGFHLLSVSLNLGEFLTTFFSSDLVAAYTNYVVAPVEAVFKNTSANTILLLLIWGAFGLVVYSVFAYVIGTIAEWHTTERQIQFERPGEVVRHPLQRVFVTRLLWRLGISIFTFLFTVALAPLIKDYLLNDNWLFGTASLGQDALHIVLSVLGWALVCHGYVVLLRLYLFRTRVFGEILY